MSFLKSDALIRFAPEKPGAYTFWFFVIVFFFPWVDDEIVFHVSKCINICIVILSLLVCNPLYALYVQQMNLSISGKIYQQIAILQVLAWGLDDSSGLIPGLHFLSMCSQVVIHKQQLGVSQSEGHLAKCGCRKVFWRFHRINVAG